VLHVLAQQRRVALQALALGSPVQRADVGPPASENLQAGLRTDGRVADQCATLQLGGHQCHCAMEQRVVAASDDQAIREQSTMTRFEQPLVHQVAREQPLAGQPCCRNPALVDQRIHFLVVDLQVARHLAHIHETRRLVGGCLHRGRIVPGCRHARALAANAVRGWAPGLGEPVGT
jgi:hypothetical protein